MELEYLDEDKKGETDKDTLQRIKKNIEQSYLYFNENYKYFYRAKSLIHNSMVTDADAAKLQTYNMPPLNVNVCESYQSRLIGEFSKSEPGITVTQNPEGVPVSDELIDILDGYLRHTLHCARHNGVQSQCFKDQLAGFSVMKLTADYKNEMSFQQEVKLELAFDATLCGFDPLARLPHKGDGNYAFELYPLSKEEFKSRYPDVDISKLKFSSEALVGSTGFSWSYFSNNTEIILVADYYEKKKKRAKIHMLSNGLVFTSKELKEYLAKFDKIGATMGAKPVVTKTRITELEVICRYTLVENKIIEDTETPYTVLPLIFVDGNSVMLRREQGRGETFQMTRSYFHNAFDAQRLKNLAAQTLGFEMENYDGTSFVIAQESIPDNQEYVKGWINPKGQKTLVYKSMLFDETGVTQLPQPQTLERSAFPSDIANLFMGLDNTIQNVLGAFDTNMAQDNNNLSGKAIIEAATQGNTTAMPYIVNYITAWNQIAVGIIGMLPKIYLYPRSLETVDKKGTRKPVKINGANTQMNYRPSDLNVEVTAGVNFEVEKQKSLKVIMGLAQEFQSMQQLVNTEGLPLLLKNLNIYGISEWMTLAEQQTQMNKQMQAQAMQNPPPNPLVIRAQADQQKAQNEQARIALDHHVDLLQAQTEQQRLAIEKFQAVTDRLAQHNDAVETKLKYMADMHKAGIEADTAAADIMLRHTEQQHGHAERVLDKVSEITQGLEEAAKPKVP